MKACEHLWKSDAVEGGGLSAQDAASFERHSRACTECRDRVARGKRLRELVHKLPSRSWGELPFRRARERLLGEVHARAYGRPLRVRGWLVAAAVLMVALVVLLARHPRAPSPADSWSGFVTADAQSVWSRGRTADVETVRLTDGRLHLVVRKQRPGERFRVETPDGEVEVRGTTFDVEVSAGSTRRVEVLEGLVAVRLQGRAPFELAAGQAWERPAPAAAKAPAPPGDSVEAPPATASPAIAGAPSTVSATPTSPRAARGASAETADYASAMAAYQRGRYDDAAAAFRVFAVRHRDSSLNEDATFLEALSLTKAGRAEAGAAAAWRHLAEFPVSFHAKEASILVARSARDRGDCDEARRTLARFTADGADRAVREALGRCDAR